ncbi:hypothetical protein [Nonomuraea sp. NPDC048901]|uniref:hypothetical protein n=1 Tax=Nonomuraea sp. NPDC048901 TaxID=3155627 RepID=UPI00340CA2CA
MSDTRPLYEGDNEMAARHISAGDWWDLEEDRCTCGATLKVAQGTDGDHTIECTSCEYVFTTDEDGVVTDWPRTTTPPAPVVIVVDEAAAIFGGMTGHGKNPGLLTDLLEKARNSGAPIVITDSKGATNWS